MNAAIVLETLRRYSIYREWLEALEQKQVLPAQGIPRAVRLPLLAALTRDWPGPVLWITDRGNHALSQREEARAWLGEGVNLALFAEPTPLFYEQASWGAATRQERLQALTSLAVYHLPFAEKPSQPPILFTSVRALMTRTMPRRDFLKACKRLTPGTQMSIPALLRWAVQAGYTPVNTVIEVGQIAHRGGIVDLWPPSAPSPLRLDFFGDEIESIRRFDPGTQRTTGEAPNLLLTPAREYLLPEAETATPDSYHEFHIPLLHPQPASLLDYLPPSALILLEDVPTLESIAEELEREAIRLRKDAEIPADFPLPYLSWSELWDRVQDYAWSDLGHSGAAEENPWTQDFAPLPHFGGRLKHLIEHIAARLIDGETVVIASRQAARLREVWQEHGLSDVPTPLFWEVSLSQGFQTKVPPALHLFTDAEIFGWERAQPRPRPVHGVIEAPESAYGDLRPGDYVVHIDHGIGRYLGLTRRILEGVEREFLVVEYENGSQLFVPPYQADRLSRYVAPGDEKPTLDRLGGEWWSQRKARVRQAVIEVAQELLDLYARRQVARGHAFSPDTDWQRELEDSFPYIETEDQKRAIQEIKRDMERPRPMDRLLCGDVGYGKTEVALRAAFKAVMDGKQVAMLVPTTILAQQHYETFRQRLAAFPVKVEMLSRFRSPAEQTAILRQLAEGQIDILIGTHRLLQPDVQFKDLGLVIIDEEQRFGVAHKEYFKKLRTEVDVLTLTATPIPRTLYMALSGIRDISMLNTPPEERLPVVTYVGPYSPQLVRQAILRELERGGQVFFVHNRVQTIHAMKAHLQRLVPQAEIAVAHGQMPEDALAEVMQRFSRGEVDVLLSTSIIESGLDIPNANTLIVDRADTFGLAQLYQLRGRVGRGAVRAYAYFFRHRKLPPTPEGQQRLEAIAEYTDLGSGYWIALRDLEIRGAGELLGTRQHGHIAAVGFHLYTRLLADAVRRLRQLRADLPPMPADQPSLLDESTLSLPVNVELPLAMGLPQEYIPDADLRLRLYRRLADVRTEAELEMLEQEFRDRFGPLPEMASNLFYQMRVKLRAERAGLASVTVENGRIVLRYPSPPTEKEPPRLPDYAPDVHGGRGAYYCTFLDDPNWQARLLEVLEGVERLSKRAVVGAGSGP
ncbi:MAG: transcription-repair coupling factor [Anaerolineales bacterium]